MRIALAQINPKAGDTIANRDKIIEQIFAARGQEADIVIFCEMAMTGTPCFDLCSNESFVENALFEISELAEHSRDIDILIGTPLIIDGEAFSGALHISRGEIEAEYHRSIVTSHGDLGYIAGLESPAFPEDNAGNIVEVAGERLLLAIGEDIGYLDELGLLGSGNISAVVNMASNRFYHDVFYEETSQRCAIASSSSLPVITVNAVGASCDTVYYGGSSVVNSRGELILSLPLFEEGFAILDTETIGEYEPIPLKRRSGKGRTKEVYKAIITALRDYFGKRGFTRACLGLSGGLDSAVVTAMACRALGAGNVDVILMPSQYSSDHSVSDALDMVHRLGIKSYTLPIEGIYDSFMEQLGKVFGDRPACLAEENLQARIRGTLMMAYSNKFGHLLLNTSNKSESAVGYGTLYGDTNGALSILGDLYKSEVYDLARYINEEGEPIPQNIIDKEPSAELCPGQRDCDSLPSYDVLDSILRLLIEEGMEASDIVAEGFDMVTVKRVEGLLRNSEYKRYQLPPVVRLSRVTLGKDRVMPF